MTGFDACLNRQMCVSRLVQKKYRFAIWEVIYHWLPSKVII